MDAGEKCINDAWGVRAEPRRAKSILRISPPSQLRGALALYQTDLSSGNSSSSRTSGSPLIRATAWRAEISPLTNRLKCRWTTNECSFCRYNRTSVRRPGSVQLRMVQIVATPCSVSDAQFWWKQPNLRNSDACGAVADHLNVQEVNFEHWSPLRSEKTLKT